MVTAEYLELGEETYEATKARQSTWAQPDKIHWSRENAYRNCPYRQLHHQKGTIGRFHVRLLEASSLKRSYWSALALGPVKHLGLSKAHGAISSYAIISLNNNERVTSPVVPNNDDPVWTTSASYSLSLKKGAQEDGTPLVLKIEMMEDATAAEQKVGLLPGLVPSPTDRLLGTASLDITALCLGQDAHGKLHAGVMDQWIPLYKDTSNNNNNGKKKDGTQQQQQDNKNTVTDSHDDTQVTVTGRVRVLVSYTPHGLDPQPHDLVALEAFARRSPLRASCRPILSQPLMPMRVLQVHENYLLCEYNMNNNNMHHYHFRGATPATATVATMRIHRNAVFVMERTNLLDGAVNLALAPTDFFLATPLGRTSAHVAQPVVEAARDLLQPALLGTRVLWAAVRTTGVAGLTGVTAATHAVWSQSREAQESRNHQASFHKTPPRRSQSSSSFV